jgi:MinD-like ATPase involved in chromosome partitioning or flagellar assembly
MSFYRHLWAALKGSEARPLVEKAMDQKNQLGIRTPFDLLETVERMDVKIGHTLKERAADFHPRLIVNQVRYGEDERLGPSMASVCRKHLGVYVECLSVVHYDDAVWQATRKKQPFMVAAPESRTARGIDRATTALLALSRDGLDRPIDVM